MIGWVYDYSSSGDASGRIPVINDLRLQNFRSYVDDSFELSPGVNIIVGPNASGKTNLLEAILMIARGASYRAKDTDLVRFEAHARLPWARLDAHIDIDSNSNSSGLAHERTIKLECNPVGVCKKSFIIDDKVLLRLSQQKTLPVVVFEPNHLLLLTGTPELRRSFLDDLIEQTVPNFGATRRHYRRVLAQRNALLKKGSHIAGPQMFVWNLRLSVLGGKMVQERLALMQRINEVVGDTYSELSHATAQVQVEYVSSLPTEQYESALLKKLEHSLERDCILGFTTAGPHREDIRLLLNGHTLQDAASRGETRTVILALKIVELHLMEAARGVYPLLLLDDVFSELDGSRRQALTTFLQKYQTFITTTDADVVVQHFMDNCTIIPMSR